MAEGRNRNRISPFPQQRQVYEQQKLLACAPDTMPTDEGNAVTPSVFLTVMTRLMSHRVTSAELRVNSCRKSFAASDIKVSNTRSTSRIASSLNEVPAQTETAPMHSTTSLKLNNASQSTDKQDRRRCTTPRACQHSTSNKLSYKQMHTALHAARNAK